MFVLCAVQYGQKAKPGQSEQGSTDKVQRIKKKIPVGGRDFPHLSTPALGRTQTPVQSVLGLFFESKTAGEWR